MLACLAATIPILTHRIPHALVVMIVMYLITREDTAATLIGSLLAVLGVTIGLSLALLAWRISLDIVWLRLCFLVVFLRRLIPQASSDHRRARLRYRSPAALVMIIPDVFPHSPRSRSSSSCGFAV
jgi:hypothetical protein